ncbi:MAG TPA: DUF59 domain-containing protein [Gemmatales bacterium]|nr:DUF59 domain-containing protein [Gemmatales bacterium]
MSGKVPLTMANQSPAEPAPATPDLKPGLSVHEQVIEMIRTCYDPEIPVNIYDLGLIYAIDVSPERAVHVKMSLTSPACPVAGSLPGMVQAKIATLPDVTAAKVELVWDPPWTQERLSEAARLQLGLD